MSELLDSEFDILGLSEGSVSMSSLAVGQWVARVEIVG